MNIYIYGNVGFRKQMRDTLNHANVKFRLNDSEKIEDIYSLDELKKTIESSPDDMYLIDEEKIIDSKALSSKIGFLRPKDGIEKSFLKEHGIGDLQVNSISDIGRQIVKKLDKIRLSEIDENEPLKIESKHTEELDVSSEKSNASTAEEFKSFLNDDIDDDYFDVDKLRESLVESEDLIADLRDENHSFDVDEDLSGLLVFDNEEKDTKVDEEKISNDELDFDNLDFDIDDLFEDDNKQHEDGIKISKEDDEMVDDQEMFGSLDSISEEDMALALDDLDGVSFDSGLKEFAQTKDVQYNPPQTQIPQIEGLLAAEISNLIGELLKNKTIEITIKIKG